MKPQYRIKRVEKQAEDGTGQAIKVWRVLDDAGNAPVDFTTKREAQDFADEMNMHESRTSTWGGAGRGQGRKITKLRIGRGFTLAVGQQVLCRETYPDGVTPGKVGVIAIENGKDGDYTILVNFDDCSWVIGVYRK